MNETIILTHDNLHALGSKNGVGWNRKQLACLGINWPPPNGWLKGLIGTEIQADKYQMAMLLRKDKQNQSNTKECGNKSKPHKMSDAEIKALCERMDKKTEKWKRQEETKRRIELMSVPKSLKKMINGPRRIHRGKSWYSH